jgi:hypothetical protein
VIRDYSALFFLFTFVDESLINNKILNEVGILQFEKERLLFDLSAKDTQIASLREALSVCFHFFVLLVASLRSLGQVSPFYFSDFILISRLEMQAIVTRESK